MLVTLCCQELLLTEFPADLSWFNGLKNTGADAEVYAPQTDPNGLIQCTITRKGASPKL